MIFRRPAPTVDCLVERLGSAAFEVGGDEARIGALSTDLDPCNDPFDPAPALGTVEEFLEAPHLAGPRAGLGPCLVACRGAGFQRQDMPAQGRGRCDAKDEVELVRPAKVDHLGAAVVAVAANQDPGGRPAGADGAQQTTEKARISVPLGRLAGRSTAVTMRPSPSNTTIGWKPYSS